MSALRYGARVGATSVLGPGRRAAIWVYGCCFSCEGCIAPGFREGAWETASPEEMADWYLRQQADGLTISGGEPMLQAAALADMLDCIRRRTDCGVIVYTGFVWEALQEKARADEGVRRLLSRIDLLIDGPYVASLDDNKPYRGSSNQRLIPLTERYRGALYTYYSGGSRAMEIHLSGQGTLMVGVPGREQAEIWKHIKQLGGDQIGK